MGNDSWQPMAEETVRYVVSNRMKELFARVRRQLEPENQVSIQEVKRESNEINVSI